jgi:hypothetical protein
VTRPRMIPMSLESISEKPQLPDCSWVLAYALPGSNPGALPVNGR